MTARDFAFWLQGFFELQQVDEKKLSISDSQAAMIQRHLNLVFVHEIDPSIDGGDSAKKHILDATHHWVPLNLNPPPQPGSMPRC